MFNRGNRKKEALNVNLSDQGNGWWVCPFKKCCELIKNK
jgi:hypothetical protein